MNKCCVKLTSVRKHIDMISDTTQMIVEYLDNLKCHNVDQDSLKAVISIVEDLEFENDLIDLECECK